MTAGDKPKRKSKPSTQTARETLAHLGGELLEQWCQDMVKDFPVTAKNVRDGLEAALKRAEHSGPGTGSSAPDKK